MFSGDIGIHMLFLVAFVVIVFAVVVAGVLAWRWIDSQNRPVSSVSIHRSGADVRSGETEDRTAQ